jgi:two-component system cell cycle sensor histidine kinase/response regulator CckA
MFAARYRFRARALMALVVLGTIVLLALYSLHAQSAQSTTKRVLILYSFDNEEGIYTGFDHVLRSQIRLRVRDRVEFYTEYLDLVRFPAHAHARDLARLLKLKYADQKPDLIVPVSYSAIEFLMGEGKGLFPGTPMAALFNVRRLENLKRQIAAAGAPKITGVASTDEPARTLDLALRLQPDTERVAVVVGSSELEHYWLDQLKEDFEPYRSKVQITYLTGQPITELLNQIAELPPHTIVFSTFFFQDATGQHFLSEEVLDLITRESHVPVYAIYSSYIGHGVVGGHMTNPEVPGRTLADRAAAILNGEKANIPFVVDDSARDTVDWRQLVRWGISESRVPPSTVELFREPSPWERYRLVIVASVALFALETFLVFVLVANVQRRRRAEKALRREKALADTVIEGLPGFFLLQDRTGKNIRWNRNAEAMARYKLGDAVLPANIADHDKQAVLKAREEVFTHGSSHVEADFLTAGGATVPFYFTGLKVELEGEPYLAAIGIDLSARRQAEEGLRRSEVQLSALVKNAPYGIGTINIRQDRFLHANPALVKLLGYKSEAEVLELEVSRDLYFDGNSSGFRAQPTRADFFNGIEFTWRRKDGKAVNVRASGRRIPYTQEQEERIEIIAEDVTARRQLEEQLRHAQKMEALGQLAGSVSHDFNNLLGVIIGYSDLLSADPSVNGSIRENLQTIKKAGERAASLTGQLLAFSRRQILQPTVVNLNALVLETQKMLERLMGEDVEQKIVLDPSLWKTKVDSGQMVQVIMNLAINSRHAMAKGGILTIKTENVTFDEATTFSGVDVASGKYVLLSVIDTGAGMDKSTLARIFEPFFTTKEAGKGTGLGLATVYGIVKQSGGYIFADSELGKGTTFRVYLPQSEPAPEIRPTGVIADSPRGSETLLVVEDEPAFRDLLRDSLQSRGYRVLVATDGVNALEIAEGCIDPIRLLITDVIMPQMSGPELAKALRQTRNTLDVLYMSGYTDDQLSDLSSSGELSLIQKPFYVDELVRRVQDILARRNHQRVGK